MKTHPDALHTVLVTDCGSTTTKALLFEKTSEGWRKTQRGEAPTTVEEPVADVTVGAENAFREIQEISGRQILASDSGKNPFLLTDTDTQQGIDLYLSTSSAGGGLQMMVAGVVRFMTAESAERAALGAGAIVLDVVCADDGREDHERIERIRHIRPDIVLITGGVDGGAQVHVLEIAETLRAAAPRPRFGNTLTLPVIYAGNKDAALEVEEILGDMAQVKIVDNVRPSLEHENLGPAREAIHDFFLTHVMSHSPGYDKLLTWTPVPVMPTPAAVGDIIKTHAEHTGKQILCADIGGATTDVFSVFRNRSDEPVFNRTVSANYGMSYSIANVMIESGASNIGRWLPFALEENEVRDRLRNKMIRPTSIPQTLDDLWLEQAVCREALFLSLGHHRSLAVGLSGTQQQRGIADIFSQESNRYQLVDMKTLDMVIGSGGVLSHAPDRLSAALMMLDGFRLEGVTEIAVDSIFMMPHLGVFASVHPEAASEIFLHDCLVHICHSIVPQYPRKTKPDTPLAEVLFEGKKVGVVKSGTLIHCNWEATSSGELTVTPVAGSIDVGSGAGKVVRKEIITGSHGFIFDGRNRPLFFHPDIAAQIALQKSIWDNLGLKQAQS